MNAIIWIKSKLLFLFKLPLFLFWLGRDFFRSKYYSWRYKFEDWGLHVYIGSFGSGKTSTMVFHAYEKACVYKQLKILTNLELNNFPPWTKIIPLKSAKDILNAPKNCLVLIDEIGTIFNSRDFAKSSESVPKILFQHLCQVRKRHMMIYATSQRWGFVDKQLRDITATVRSCHVRAKHPYSRYNECYIYDAYDYTLAESNPIVKIAPLGYYSHIQTDFRRNLYDTSELIDNMLKSEYISDKEIMENRGDISPVMALFDSASKSRKMKKRA